MGIEDAPFMPVTAENLHAPARLDEARLPGALWILDGRGAILSASASSEQLLGRTSDELVGRLHEDIFARELRGEPAAPLAILADDAAASHVVTRRLCVGDGHWRTVEGTFYALGDTYAVHWRSASQRDLDADERRAAKDTETRLKRRTAELETLNDSMSYEIRQRMAAEAALRRTSEMLAAVVHAAPMAIVVLDADGNVTLWSAGAQALFGWHATEVVGRPDPTLLPDARPPRGDVAGLASHRLHHDGRVLDVSLWATPLDEQSVSATQLVLMVDMTEHGRLVKQLIEAEETERRRLSRDLHDQVGQQVAAILMGMAGLASELPPGSRAETRLARLRAIAADVAREIHDTALALRPPSLDDHGLVTALRQLVDCRQAALGASIELQSEGFSDAGLPPSIASVVYRIAEEALGNALKHAAPRRVGLYLKRTRAEIMLIVEDDGVGFDAGVVLARAARSERLGFAGMLDRVASCGGRLEVESAPGAGTTVFVHVPAPPAPLDLESPHAKDPRAARR